jgi:hypothetical protein
MVPKPWLCNRKYYIRIGRNPYTGGKSTLLLEHPIYRCRENGWVGMATTAMLPLLPERKTLYPKLGSYPKYGDITLLSGNLSGVTEKNNEASRSG